MVHPQCRGYVHKTALLFHFLQNNSFDLRTQQQIRHSSLTAHSVAVPFLTKPSAHIAAEVVHAHNWDLTFPYKTRLSFTLIFLYIKKPHFFLFTKIPIYTSHYYKTMASNHGHPKTLNPRFKPRVYYKKKGVLTYPDTPKTILTHKSGYQQPRSYQN